MYKLLFSTKLYNLLDTIANLTKASLLNILTLRESLEYKVPLVINFVIVKVKKRYDLKYKLITFTIGDKVFLKLYDEYYLPKRFTKKLL